jgi:hypothetical protein
MTETRCPKCGFERLPEASQCPVCGVVFAKLERAPQPPAAPPPSRQAPATQRTPEAAPPQRVRQGDDAADIDPYAAPRSARIVGGPAFPGFGEPRGGYWRSERLLVMERGAELPARCVRCNAPANERIAKTLYWHNPWLYLLLVAWVLYLLTALVTRKRARIAAPLCPQHLKRRRAWITGSWTAVVASIVVTYAVAGGSSDREWLYVPCAVAFIGGLVTAVLAHRILVPKRIDDLHVWLKGAAPEFLNSVPAGPSLL